MLWVTGSQIWTLIPSCIEAPSLKSSLWLECHHWIEFIECHWMSSFTKPSLSQHFLNHFGDHSKEEALDIGNDPLVACQLKGIWIVENDCQVWKHNCISHVCLHLEKSFFVRGGGGIKWLKQILWNDYNLIWIATTTVLLIFLKSLSETIMTLIGH